MDDFRNTLDTLALEFSGEMFGPEDDRFDDARSVWNAMIDRRPALIAHCSLLIAHCSMQNCGRRADRSQARGCT